jgi:hypothetical protein
MQSAARGSDLAPRAARTTTNSSGNRPVEEVFGDDGGRQRSVDLSADLTRFRGSPATPQPWRRARRLHRSRSVWVRGTCPAGTSATTSSRARRAARRRLLPASCLRLSSTPRRDAGPSAPHGVRRSPLARGRGETSPRGTLVLASLAPPAPACSGSPAWNTAERTHGPR